LTSVRVCGADTTVLVFPDFGVSRQREAGSLPLRCVTARETVIISQPSLMSFRRNSLTSPNRIAAQALNSTRTRNRSGRIASATLASSATESNTGSRLRFVLLARLMWARVLGQQFGLDSGSTDRVGNRHEREWLVCRAVFSRASGS
jgi:hypothetical protein